MAKELVFKLVVTWLIVMAAGIGLSYVDWGSGDFFSNLGFNLTQLFKHWLKEAQAQGQEAFFWIGYGVVCLVIALPLSRVPLSEKPKDPEGS